MLASSSATGRSTARARVVVGDARARLASRVSGSFGCNLQMSSVTTHTSMIDVADLSMFPLSQMPSWAAKLVAAMAVESAAKAKAFVLKRPFAQPKDTEIFEVLGAQPRVHQRSQAQVSRLDQGGSKQDKRFGKREYHALMKEGVDKT